MNVFVVDQRNNYANWLDCEITPFHEADVVLFTGGSDVTPSLYGQKAHGRTVFDSARDAREVRYFTKALAHDKKMLGVCRGSQFLTVMNGGKLIQDVTDHAIMGVHKIVSEHGEGLMTSTHHQMMYPYDLPEDNYEVIAHPPKNMSRHYEETRDKNVDLPRNFKEPEIVYYPKTNCLGIQGHPERLRRESEGVKLCRKIFNKYLGE